MAMEVATAAPRVAHRAFLVQRFADKYGIEPNRMLETLKQTCFRTEKGISNEQMAALLLVCEANDLNPFVRMVHALLDKQGNVVPYIGLDGWISLVNRRTEYDGVEFDMSDDGTECSCTMWRKDQSHATRITEYLAEVKRGSTPWATAPRRMLRHRAYVQCARLAFGFPGLHDEFDAQQIASGEPDEPVPTTPPRKPRAPSIMNPVPTVEDIDEKQDWTPPPKALAAWIDEMMHADDQESAALICDEAKSMLPSDQHAELSAAYRIKWTPKE